MLNPLVLIHLIGGVHNEMLMVGLMAAGIALVLERRHVAGIVLVAIGVAIKATAGIALPFIVWIWMVHERERRTAATVRTRRKRAGRHRAFRAATSCVLFAKTAALGVSVFALGLPGRLGGSRGRIGWLTALSGSEKIINWLSLPTILAHMVTWVSPLRLNLLRW